MDETVPRSAVEVRTKAGPVSDDAADRATGGAAPPPGYEVRGDAESSLADLGGKGRAAPSDGARDMLDGPCDGRERRRLTAEEAAFLEVPMKGGDPDAIAGAREKLGDGSVFFEGGGMGETRSGPRASSARREKYLSERQKAQLHRMLWRVHDDRVKNTPKDRWRKMVRRVIALKGLTGTKAQDDGGDEAKGREGNDERSAKRASFAVRESLTVKMASEREGFEGSGKFEGFEMMIGDLMAHNVDEAPLPVPKDKGKSNKPHSAWDVLKSNPTPDKDIEKLNRRRSAWDVLKSGQTPDKGDPLPFLILGTSAEDVSCHPHVMSPPLMEALRSSFPFVVSEDNFWLKYSLIRDGSSLVSLLQHVRAAKHTVVAVETVGGEVFGSFTSMPWRKTHGYFGTGQSFLWRMRETRGTACTSVDEQAALEGKIDVYKWRGVNDVIQICRADRIAVGGGDNEDAGASGAGLGFGFMIEDDLLQGLSSPSVTFGNPRLCPLAPDGIFEIANMEVWTLTPFMLEEDAEKNEMMRMFVEEQG